MVTALPPSHYPPAKPCRSSARAPGAWARAARTFDDEVAALKLGLDLGMTLIDTAEMYGDGDAEEVVAEAVEGRRDECSSSARCCRRNASRAGTIAACERSLKRLKTDRIDLYLLHWRGRHRLEETLAGFQALMRAGAIGLGRQQFRHRRHGGAVRARAAAAPAPATRSSIISTRRGIEADLIPWCRAHHIPIMAYSPIEQGRLSRDRTLAGSPRATGLRRRRWRSPGCCGRRT